MNNRTFLKTLAVATIAAVISVFDGCSLYNAEGLGNHLEEGVPRLVIKGVVTNLKGEALQGILVSIYGVYSESENALPNYNYALTDSKGMYEIIRYRGRLYPENITMEATDPSNHYAGKIQTVPVFYSSENGFATVDFTLEIYPTLN